MDISVIVVTYNQADTIGRTLDSVLGQVFEGSFEVIVGDDCSSDGTRAICEEYARRYPDKVRYLRRERNLGVVGNYFDCIRRARGRYLADCAGDDQWVDPRKLAHQFDYLERHPDVTAVYTDWLCCNVDGTDPRRHELRPEVHGIETYERGALVFPVLTNSIMPHLCTALYRKSVVEKYMDGEPSRFMGLMVEDADAPLSLEGSRYVAEDPQIMMALSAEGRTAVLPGATLYYSVGGDSISRRRDYGRRLQHFVRETSQQLEMAELFGVGREALSGYLRGKLDYMWSLAWRSDSREAVAALRGLVAKFGLRGGIKSKIYGLMVRLK